MKRSKTSFDSGQTRCQQTKLTTTVQLVKLTRCYYTSLFIPKFSSTHSHCILFCQHKLRVYLDILSKSYLNRQPLKKAVQCRPSCFWITELFRKFSNLNNSLGIETQPFGWDLYDCRLANIFYMMIQVHNQDSLNIDIFVYEKWEYSRLLRCWFSSSLFPLTFDFFRLNSMAYSGTCN